MRLAIIDLGTNSVRFDIYEVASKNNLQRLHREKLMIRLGEGVFVHGKLNRQAVRRTLVAFKSFAQTIEKMKAEKVIAFGTSVLRDAIDRDRLVDQVYKTSGIKLRVISGHEEGQLIAKGILGNEKSLPSRFALVDIGGGSVEVSICAGRRVQFTASYDLGVARMQQVFLQTNPPRAAQKGVKTQILSPVDQLRFYVRSLFKPSLPLHRWPKIQTIIGSSGTVSALAKIFKKSQSRKGPFTQGQLARLIDQMQTMSIAELLEIPGMEQKRADLILAGSIVLDEIMRALQAQKVRTSEFSLRDGILKDEMQKIRPAKQHAGTFHPREAYDLAASLGCDMQHAEQVTHLSLRLFDLLKSFHKMKPKWKKYLAEAAMLHDVGASVTPINHALHSHYIVSHALFSSMEDWEQQFISHLCLFHTNGKVDSRNLPFWRNKTKRQTFMKLLAILRVADALDSKNSNSVRVLKKKSLKKTLTLQVAGKTSLNLELLRFEQKKGLFEKIFKKTLLLDDAGPRR